MRSLRQAPRIDIKIEETKTKTTTDHNPKTTRRRKTLRGMPDAPVVTAETSSKKDLKRTQAQEYKSRDSHEMLLGPKSKKAVAESAVKKTKQRQKQSTKKP